MVIARWSSVADKWLKQWRCTRSRARKTKKRNWFRMTRVEFRVIFEVYYMRSMELPGVIFVSLFLAFSCLDCVRGISKSKKKKKKKKKKGILDRWVHTWHFLSVHLSDQYVGNIVVSVCPRRELWLSIIGWWAK